MIQLSLDGKELAAPVKSSLQTVVQPDGADGTAALAEPSRPRQSAVTVAAAATMRVSGLAAYRLPVVVRADTGVMPPRDRCRGRVRFRSESL